MYKSAIVLLGITTVLLTLLAAEVSSFHSPAFRTPARRVLFPSTCYSTATPSSTTLECLDILKRAALSRKEDSDTVLEALTQLEKLARKESDPQQIKDSLNGSWQLVFTTGTATTQQKYGKINYFPLKAVQSFNTADMTIENGIYVGDFPLVQFSGAFDFDLVKRRLEFTFDQLCLLQFINLQLGAGDAEQLGSASGLGSDSNVELAKKNKKAFFNWISADETIATARGGGGGLALWKRVES